MRDVLFNLGHVHFPLRLPDGAAILPMGRVVPLGRPREAIRQALNNPLGVPRLLDITKTKRLSNPRSKAVIVISDATRPVPYRGEHGILVPIIEDLMAAGLGAENICLLVATGTHRAMRDRELRDFLDPTIFDLGLNIINHDCRKTEDLVRVGKTHIGGEILISRHYIESDIKILTGLVESHFMAGVSGGRKSICPGLLAEDSTHMLHGGAILDSPRAADLVLEGNPVHEEALHVARMAGCDFIVNVTLDADYRLTGVYAGDMEKAHLAAVSKLMAYAAVPVQKRYDLVVTQAGFVGVNHYQAAKGAQVCAPLIRENGICLLAAHHTDNDPLGQPNYKRMLRLLNDLGTKKFLETILDPSWTFVPDQWEAQMWTRLFKVIPPENLLYCSLEISKEDFAWVPGTDGRILAPKASTLKELTEKCLNWAVDKLRQRLGREPELAILPDGPYAIPVLKP